MKKILISLLSLFFVLALIFSAKSALATVRCDTQYEEVCREIRLEIDKEVWDPYNERFEENLFLDAENYVFGPGEIIRFKIKVTNVGDETFNKVYVEDYLPDYLVLESGDLSYEIDDLDPGETDVKEFEARVVSSEEFPDNTTICEDNRAKAWSGDESDENTAEVCLREKVLGIEELPPTGPENWLIFLSFSLLIGLVGIYLIRLNKK